MASIEKWPGGRWRAHWRTPEGKPQSKVFDKKVTAQQHLTAMESSKLLGAYVDPKAGKVTFKAFAEQWRSIQPHRQGTETSVEQNLRLHVYPHLGPKAIASLRPSHVQAMVTKLGQGDKPLAAGTIERIYKITASVFAAAVNDRIITASPCRKIQLPLAAPNKMVPLTVEQVATLRATTPARYKALIDVGAWAGLRMGEALGLTVDRVDFLRRTITVDRQLVLHVGSPPILAPPKTEASTRTLPVPQVVLDALAAHIAEYGSGPDGLIFTNRDGRAVRSSAFSKRMLRTAIATEVPATYHDLRHFCASALIARGVSVKGVQTFMGHASATVTLDVYGHLWPDSDDEIRGALDGLAAGVSAVAPQRRRSSGRAGELTGT